VTDCRHWYSGRFPTTPIERRQAQVEEMYAREEARERDGRFDVLSEYVAVVTESDPEESADEDPVTCWDRMLWTWQESDAETDRRLHMMTHEQREQYDTAVQAKVNAKAFAKRFEAWCEKGCPLETEGKE
jgi:hypothetical protein